MPEFVYQIISLSLLAPSISFFSRSADESFSSSFHISSGDFAAAAKFRPAVRTMKVSKEIKAVYNLKDLYRAEARPPSSHSPGKSRGEGRRLGAVEDGVILTHFPIKNVSRLLI